MVPLEVDVALLSKKPAEATPTIASERKRPAMIKVNLAPLDDGRSRGLCGGRRSSLVWSAPGVEERAVVGLS